MSRRWPYPVSKERRYRYYYRTWAGGKTNEVITQPLKEGWYHFMARWSAKQGHIEVFIDDKRVKATTYNATRCAQAHRLALGGRTGTFGTWGDGGSSWGPMDELRLSRGLRPPAMPTKAPVPDTNTLLLLHFDEENGQFPTDASGRDWTAAGIADAVHVKTEP